ncbi:MAG: type IA DNA topoisomerase, partial [Synechococcales bacterium]|nr:type IA DNA topoisomerase [Synechococcales bacterium]
AVREAIAHPRSLDQSLVAAGRARDCLDKLVGYKGSRHVVWPLNNGAKSMGRVQSATLHLLCLREREIQTFVPQDYWSVWVTYQEGFKAFYRSSPQTQKRPAKNATKDTAAEDGVEGNTDKESERITTQERADQLVAIARSFPHQVLQVEGKQVNQSPPPPFVTSTLQQAAGSKLHLNPESTMKVAQSLYEKGHITYMRTDSVVLAAPFCEAVRQYLQQHDPTNLPAKATQHRAVKGSQEAHEAIRASVVNRLPSQLQATLSGDEARLYELIWNRAIASQCAPARLRKTRVVTQSGEAYWEARGQVLEFAGYTRYWNNISADSVLPPLTAGQSVDLQQAQADQKQTQPPPRYSEPKLIKLMEQKGIGRPSTYAPTLKTLRQREYVKLVQGKLIPTPLGLELDSALEKLLPDLIQPDFTAQMEQALDAIATGQQEWQAYLINWHQSYFAPALRQAQTMLQTQIIATGGDRPPKAGSQPVSQAKSPPQAKSATPSKNSSSKTLSKIKCPNCGQLMSKVPSRSPKLKAKHFLKCPDAGCGAVMFWNATAKRYELPYAKRALNPDAFTDHPCPVCGALLERYTYTKEGQEKVMLRCSLVENRRDKCQEVAFFQSKGEFWSPKFGTLPSSNLSQKPT